MLFRLLLVLPLLFPAPAAAAVGAGIDLTGFSLDLVKDRIVPAHHHFAAAAADLAERAAAYCAAPDGARLTALRDGFHAAADAWMALQWLQLGPGRILDRSLRIDFWPDGRDSVGRQLAALLAAPRPELLDPAGLARASVAVQGLPALERLLFGDGVVPAGSYRCGLVRAIAGNLRSTGAALAEAWDRRPGDPQAGARAAIDAYSAGSDIDFAAEIYQSLLGHLQAIVEVKLHRPLGDGGRVRPTRAEMWRSGRPMRNVGRNLDAVGPILVRLARLVPDAAGLAAETEAALAAAQQAAAAALGTTPANDDGRRRWRAAADAVAALHRLARDRIGPGIGLAAGFNALDGD